MEFALTVVKSILSLSVSATRNCSRPRDVSRRRGQGGGRMKTVFVVDDDSLMRAVLTRHLERMNYCVRPFALATTALTAILAEEPDVLISDVQMPGMTGLELVAALREEGSELPVVLVTGRPTEDVVDEAMRLGVAHVCEKPIKDYSGFLALVAGIMVGREDGGDDTGLDRVRLDFLTGLSHELRTPLTAIKLALDGLFSDNGERRPTSETKLLTIGQRNIDRIINMVDRRLSLLQVTLGEVTLARRLVDLRTIVSAAAADRPAGRLPEWDGEWGANLLLFTDPERLQTVVEYILGSGEHVDVEVSFADDQREIVMTFDGTGMYETDLTREPDTRGAGGNGAWRPSVEVEGHRFEGRACRRLIEALGIGMRIDNESGRERVALRIPVLPDFDYRTDFTTPVKVLREAATLSGRSISMLRCRLKTKRRLDRSETSFFRGCLRAVGEGDILVRGREDGTYFLALLERPAEELDEIRGALLDSTRLEGEGESLETTVVHTIAPGAIYPDSVLDELEAVR